MEMTDRNRRIQTKIAKYPSTHGSLAVRVELAVLQRPAEETLDLVLPVMLCENNLNLTKI